MYYVIFERHINQLQFMDIIWFNLFGVFDLNYILKKVIEKENMKVAGYDTKELSIFKCDLQLCLCTFKIICIISLFSEQVEGREKRRESSTGCLLYLPQQGTKFKTQVHALTRN